MAESVDLDEFIALQTLLVDIEEHALPDVVARLCESPLLVSAAGRESVARAFHLAIKYRPLSHAAYLAVLSWPCGSAALAALAPALLRTIFHFLNTVYAFPSECGSISFLYHACPSLIGEGALFGAIRAFVRRAAPLPHLWVVACFAPVIARFDGALVAAARALYAASDAALGAHRAAFAGFYDAVDALREREWEAHRPFVLQCGTLARALARNDVAELRRLSAYPGFAASQRVRGALFEPCWFCRDDPTLIQYAAYHRAEECVDFLHPLSDVALTDSRNKTLAQFAAAGGSVAILSKVYRWGLPATDVMHVAAGYFRTDIFFWVLEAHVRDLGAESPSYETAALAAAASGNLYLLKYCLDQGIDVNASTSVRKTALHYGCYIGQVEMVRFLLGVPRVDVNALTSDRLTPLMLAVQHGHWIPAALLLGRPEIDVNLKNVEDCTALHLGCQAGRIRAVRALLAHPALDVNATINVRFVSNAENDWPPLFIALRERQMEILQLLVDDPRTDVNFRDPKDDTPLHFALELGSVEAVRILLACQRVKVNLQDHWKVFLSLSILLFTRQPS
jgi:ankyrin repeat protein